MMPELAEPRPIEHVGISSGKASDDEICRCGGICTCGGTS